MLLILPAVSLDAARQMPGSGPNGSGDHSVIYVSSNSRFAMVFTDKGFRTGDSTALDKGRWPDVPTRVVDNKDNMQCISVGYAGNSEEFAIKRPIKAGSRYRCLGTTFKVEKCFGGCESAIVQRDIPLTGGRSGTLPSYMLVDRCSGMLALSPFRDMNNGIPLDAMVLRGFEGILADKEQSGCR